jgi:prophage regulatory protein
VVLVRNSYRGWVDLMSTVEIAQLLNITRQRVDKLSRGERFPAPVAELAIGRVWLRSAIVEWARDSGRLPADFER